MKRKSVVTNRSTRNAQIPQIPLYRSITRRRTIYFRNVKVWNSLGMLLKWKRTLTEFKRCLKKQFILTFLEIILYDIHMIAHIDGCITCSTTTFFVEYNSTRFRWSTLMRWIFRVLLFSIQPEFNILYLQ